MCETSDALYPVDEVEEILYNPNDEYGSWIGDYFGIATGHRLAALIYPLDLPPYANHADYYPARTIIAIAKEQGCVPEFALTDE